MKAHKSLNELRKNLKFTLIMTVIIIGLSAFSFLFIDYYPSLFFIGLMFVPISCFWVGVLVLQSSHYFNRINLEALCKINKVDIKTVCQCRSCRKERDE